MGLFGFKSLATFKADGTLGTFGVFEGRRHLLQAWQAGPRQATTDVVGMSSVMASSSKDGDDFAACMLGALDLPVSIPLERWEVDTGTGASAEVIQTNMLRFAALADGVDRFDAAAFRSAPQFTLSTSLTASGNASRWDGM